MPARGASVPPKTTKAALRLILKGSDFARAPSLRRGCWNSWFWSRFRGGATSLKEYTIGVRVFDRGPEFDPRIDPIVRVQAAKLRRLRSYYATEGVGDEIVIELPRGAYVPCSRFRKLQPSTERAAGAPARRRSNRLSIAVLPFENLSGDPSQSYLSDGISEELIGLLSRLRRLRVVARTSSFLFRDQQKSAQEIGQATHARYLVEGSVRAYPPTSCGSELSERRTKKRRRALRAGCARAVVACATQPSSSSSAGRPPAAAMIFSACCCGTKS